jgi:competence protein ComEA
MEEMEEGDKDSIFSLLQKYSLHLLIFGLILIGAGILFVKEKSLFQPSEVQIINADTQSGNSSTDFYVEVAGAVNKPGVYKLASDLRVNDLILLAGGFSSDADFAWIEKTINKASKLVDGQKIYIPRKGEQANYTAGTTSVQNQGSGLVNINTASLAELDKLPGIGPVYAQKIIDARPYSDINELITKNAVTRSVFEKIKEQVSVY